MFTDCMTSLFGKGIACQFGSGTAGSGYKAYGNFWENRTSEETVMAEGPVVRMSGMVSQENE